MSVSYGFERVPLQIASLLKENNDLLRENNAVHTEHIKLEKKLLYLTVILAILTAALLIVAIPPAYEVFFHSRPLTYPKTNDHNPSDQTKNNRDASGNPLKLP